MTGLTMVAVATLFSGAWAGEPPEFTGLEHTTRPLAQQGSGNLLPNADFADGLEGWGAEGDVSVEEIDGGRVLRLGPIGEEQVAHVRVYLPEPKGGTLYRLRFEVKIAEDAELTWKSHSGLYGWFSHSSPTRGSAGALRINEYRRTGEWMPRELFLFTHPDVAAVYLSLSWHANAGDALLRGFEVVEAPVPAEDGRVILETPAGDWAELLDVTPQVVPPERPTAWVARDPDTLRPRSIPTRGDLERDLYLAGTPGEMTVGAIGLYTPHALAAARVTAGELAGEAGELGAEPSVRQMVFMPRRTNYYGRGRTFHYVPDFFLDFDAADCPAGETTGFWVSLRVPEDATPGEYHGTVTVSADGFERTIAVDLVVHPFELADLPGRARYLYLDTGRWRNMSDAQVLAEIADVRDHGYESIPLAAAGDMIVEGGHIVDFRLADYAERMIHLAQEGGFEGPFGFWTGRFPEHVRARLELPEDALEGYADTWPPAVAAGTIEAQRELREAVTAAGIEEPFIIAIDEPGYWKEGSPERYAWDMAVAGESGWETYCTTSTPPPDQRGLHVTYHCYGGGHMYRDPEHAREIVEVTHEHGQQCWYYCTGSYSGQIGNMLRNRYLAGFMFFRCGADGTASWTFQRPRGNAFDDFRLDERGNERTGQPCTTYPDPRNPGLSLDTPHWEGLRQAWYDHRYAATLQQLIDAARERDPQTADAAQERLDALMESLPWNGDPFLDERLTNARLDEVRAAIVEEIIRLQGE